jgi:hypothetical protein
VLYARPLLAETRVRITAAVASLIVVANSLRNSVGLGAVSDFSAHQLIFLEGH